MPRKKKITINDPQKEKFVPQEEETLQQLGQKIREARISKNLSLESVSGHLHIAVNSGSDRRWTPGKRTESCVYERFSSHILSVSGNR